MKLLRFFPLFLFAALLHAEDTRRNWQLSLVFVAESSTADILSSRHLRELNPILGRGPFGSRQVTVKSAIVGGLLTTEWLTSRHHAGRYPRWTRFNLLFSSTTFAVSVWNVNQH